MFGLSNVQNQMFQIKFLLCLMFAVAFGSANAEPLKLSEGAFMARCYAHLTGRKIPTTHALLIDSIQKNSRAVTVQNCMKLFDKTRLTPGAADPVATGYPSGSLLDSDQDQESIAVLNYFYSYYTIGDL